MTANAFHLKLVQTFTLQIEFGQEKSLRGTNMATYSLNCAPQLFSLCACLGCNVSFHASLMLSFDRSRSRTRRPGNNLKETEVLKIKGLFNISKRKKIVIGV